MVTITKATLDDVATIRTLADKVWWATYPAILTDEQIRYMLDLFYSSATITEQIGNNSQTYLIIKDGNDAVGFAAYGLKGDGSENYKLHKLYCDAQKHRKGYGRLLLREVEQQVKAIGKNKLFLNVNRYNPAKNFYAKMGYEVADVEDINIGNDFFMNDYVMSKIL